MTFDITPGEIVAQVVALGLAVRALRVLRDRRSAPVRIGSSLPERRAAIQSVHIARFFRRER